MTFKRAEALGKAQEAQKAAEATTGSGVTPANAVDRWRTAHAAWALVFAITYAEKKALEGTLEALTEAVIDAKSSMENAFDQVAGDGLKHVD